MAILTSQPFKCPYCGHINRIEWGIDEGFASDPYIVKCEECEEHFAARVVIRFEVQTQSLRNFVTQESAGLETINHVAQPQAV